MIHSDASPVVILGAGLTGLATAYHLRTTPYLLLEREDGVGGKARSHRREGHTFDVTGHWLHLRDARVKSLVGELFDPTELVEIERRTGVWSHGAMLAYPFQANLHGLPLEVVQECLVGFIRAREAEARGDATAPRTFEEYAIARFGAGIARHFFVPYNTKLWGTHPNELTPKMVTRFIPVPDVEQVVGGAIGLVQEGLGYNVRFLYPRAGGIDALPRAMAARLEAPRIRCGSAVDELDVEGRRVRAGGEWHAYSRLVSTMPLPELVRRIPAAPAEVHGAAASLRSVPWRYLDVATRTSPPTDLHWIYAPDPDLPFFRVGVYSNALPAMAPPGGGSLYVELVDRASPPDLPAVFRSLTDMGAITSPEDVSFCEVHDVDHAYVMFDDAWEDATNTIHAWLASVGVRSCGRYGSWIYNSMEDSILQGMEAARWAEGAA